MHMTHSVAHAINVCIRNPQVLFKLRFCSSLQLTIEDKSNCGNKDLIALAPLWHVWECEQITLNFNPWTLTRRLTGED